WGQWARPESWRPWPTATDATFFHAGLAKLPGLLGVAVQSGVRWRRAAESAFRTPSASRSVVYTGVPGCCRQESSNPPASTASKPRFVDKPQDDGFGLCIVPRNRQGNSTRRSTRPTALEQMARIDFIKRFDSGPSNFLFAPAVFGLPRLVFCNPPIALAGIVVAGTHDAHARWPAGKQRPRRDAHVVAH